MNPIEIPDDWDDRGLITFEEFCELIRTPQRTVRDWRQCGVGRRFLSSATPTRHEERADG